MKIYPFLLVLLLITACQSSTSSPNNEGANVPLAPTVSSPQGVTESSASVPSSSSQIKNSKYPDPSSIDMKDVTVRPWSPQRP